MKIFEKVSEDYFACPICDGAIERRIDEKVVVKIDQKGNAFNLANDYYTDDFVCSKCGDILNDIIKSDSIKGGWRITSRGVAILNKDKNMKVLAKNPFGKEEV